MANKNDALMCLEDLIAAETIIEIQNHGFDSSLLRGGISVDINVAVPKCRVPGYKIGPIGLVPVVGPGRYGITVQARNEDDDYFGV